MGSKIAARRRMRAAGVPIVPGTTSRSSRSTSSRRVADELGYPLAIKASAGGGGKGLKIVAAEDELERAFESARREGEAYFADPTVFVERYLEDPRHVEVQVLADAHGNVIHLGERDCTIQRRHQKLVEETPSPAVDDELRARIGAIAVEAARAVGYRSAGTVEGLLTARRRVLLPGDEHAHPGRAHRHRARDRSRPRARAGADRRGRATLDRGRRTSSCAATRSSAGSTPRTSRQGFLPGAGEDHALSRARRPRCPRRLGRARGRRDSRRSTTR